MALLTFRQTHTHTHAPFRSTLSVSLLTACLTTWQQFFYFDRHWFLQSVSVFSAKVKFLGPFKSKNNVCLSLVSTRAPSFRALDKICTSAFVCSQLQIKFQLIWSMHVDLVCFTWYKIECAKILEAIKWHSRICCNSAAVQTIMTYSKLTVIVH